MVWILFSHSSLSSGFVRRLVGFWVFWLALASFLITIQLTLRLVIMHFFRFIRFHFNHAIKWKPPAAVIYIFEANLFKINSMISMRKVWAFFPTSGIESLKNHRGVLINVIAKCFQFRSLNEFPAIRCAYSIYFVFSPLSLPQLKIQTKRTLANVTTANKWDEKVLILFSWQ